MLHKKKAQRDHSQVLYILFPIIFSNVFQYIVLGCYNKFQEPGTYLCVVCDQSLFSSDTKFDSGCGWPAFKDVIDEGKVKLTADTSAGIKHEFSS